MSVIDRSGDTSEGTLFDRYDRAEREELHESEVVSSSGKVVVLAISRCRASSLHWLPPGRSGTARPGGEAKNEGVPLERDFQPKLNLPPSGRGVGHASGVDLPSVSIEQR